ncbi:ABC transporter permease [Roseomonas sp. GC11]|uniref:ABC transporter permease n=1 Tax=Roseomonas sp. GC11 TaxID=2950546 RepID=UPI00210A6D77|nr:ABC transporter permease [Roseomonas sp. GC11]MCQ4162536.1 ABC transporter permease [Roseomonas sp. GC11]
MRGAARLPSPGIGWLALPACAVAALLFALPLLLLLAVSLHGDGGWTLRGYARFLGAAYSWQVIGRTLALAFWTTLICLALGYPAAFALARTRGAVQSLLIAALLLPLSLSVIVKAFGWTVLLRGNGVVNRLLMASGLTDAPLRLLFTEAGLLIGITNIFLPFMILPIFTVVRQIDPRLGDAATTLGGGPWHNFVRVTLPLTLPGVVAGVTLVFSLSIAAYVIPNLLMGDRYQTLSTTIATAFLYLQDPQRGSVAGVVLLALSLAVVVGSAWLARRARATP